MMTPREKRDLQWLTIAIVIVVSGFAWGVFPGLVCSAAAVVAGVTYHRRWRPTLVRPDPPADLDALWVDAELALRRLEFWRCDAVPEQTVDRLARAGRRAIETGRIDPFSPCSGEIRHVLGMIGDCLGAMPNPGGQRFADQERRLARVFHEATQTLERLSRKTGVQDKTLQTHIRVLEREVGLLNNKEKA